MVYSCALSTAPARFRGMAAGAFSLLFGYHSQIACHESELMDGQVLIRLHNVSTKHIHKRYQFVAAV
jgi:hypothetical protein